jgi:hypothetical protein
MRNNGSSDAKVSACLFASRSSAGLPDGLFSKQKSQIWVNFGGTLKGKCWYII